MIQLIVGDKGTGKTKQMIEIINHNVKIATGNVVCIEKGMKLTFNLDHKCRLIDMEEYAISGYDMLYGFISGILACNYDIEQIFIDGILKILDKNLDTLGRLLEALENLHSENVTFVITVSSSLNSLPESVKKYV